MRKIKTHKFLLGKYHVEYGDGWDGVCDVPGKPGEKERLTICVLNGNDRRTLRSQIHEALHADDCPESFVHRADDPCDNLARWLMRNGWKRGNG